LKFASLIFLLSSLVIAANVSLAANNNAFNKHLLAIDTIIQRDTLSKVKPTPGKKGKPAKGGKPVSAAKDTSSKPKGRLESMVKWSAEDSTYSDNERNIMYLYGKARVTYEDFELDADYIRVDQKTIRYLQRGV
jgi:lipopolysaccharide assembly outer membrane protein LptD (OstA)